MSRGLQTRKRCVYGARQRVCNSRRLQGRGGVVRLMGTECSSKVLGGAFLPRRVYMGPESPGCSFCDSWLIKEMR